MQLISSHRLTMSGALIIWIRVYWIW